MGTIWAELGLDSTKFNQGMRTAEQKFATVGRKMRGVGLGLTAAVSLPLALIGKKALTMAMDVVESENLFEVSMGNMADAARDWSIQLRDDLGLNEYEVRKSVATFNVMFDSMGIGTQAAYDMATGLSQLTYDMASFYNLEPEVAFQKLQAGITGEIEPLKRLGILVSENTTKQWAYNNGLVAQGKQLTEQEKVLARYGTIMEQTSKAQGDMGRTLESPANQLRIFKDQVNMLMVDLGKELIPIFQDVLEYAKDLTEWFGNLTDEQKSLAVKIGLVAAAAGPALLIFGQMAIVIPAVTKAINRMNVASKGLLGPLGLVLTACTLVTIGFDKLSDTVNNKFIRAVLEGLSPMQTMWESFGRLKTAIDQYREGNINLWQALTMTRAETKEFAEATEEQISIVQRAQGAISEYSSTFPEASEKLQELNTQFGRGNIGLEEYTEKTLEVISKVEEYIRVNSLLNSEEELTEQIEHRLLVKRKELAEELDILTGATEENTEAIEEQEKSVDDLRSAFGELTDTLFDGIFSVNDMEEAEIALREAQEKLNQLVKEGKESTDEMTLAVNDVDEANLKYINSLYGITSSLLTTRGEQEEAKKDFVDFGLALVESGDIGSNAFINMAKQFGISKETMSKILGDLGVDIDKLPKEIQVAMGVDVEEPKEVFEQTYPGWMGGYVQSEPETLLHLDEDEVDEKMNIWYPGMAQTYEDSKPETELLLDDEDTDTKFADADTLSQEWIDSNPETKILADNSQALEAIQEVINKSIPDKHFTVYEHHQSLYAGGGLVQKFAGGGLPHAQTGMITPNITGGIPIIAHENELILNSRQQAKLLFEIAKGNKTIKSNKGDIHLHLEYNEELASQTFAKLFAQRIGELGK